VTFETNDNYSIRFEISNNSSTIRFDSIRNEKNTIRTSLLLDELDVIVKVMHVHSVALSDGFLLDIKVSVGIF